MIPYLTEKTLRLAGEGIYTFLCPKTIEKVSIARDIEQFYNVNVLSVKTIKKRPTMRRSHRKIGYGPVMKKVLVSLKKGQKIPGFEIEAGKKETNREKTLDANTK